MPVAPWPIRLRVHLPLSSSIIYSVLARISYPPKTRTACKFQNFRLPSYPPSYPLKLGRRANRLPSYPRLTPRLTPSLLQLPWGSEGSFSDDCRKVESIITKLVYQLGFSESPQRVSPGNRPIAGIVAANAQEASVPGGSQQRMVTVQKKAHLGGGCRQLRALVVVSWFLHPQTHFFQSPHPNLPRCS